MCSRSVGVCGIKVGNIITHMKLYDGLCFSLFLMFYDGLWCYMICITSSYIIIYHLWTFMRAFGERTSVWRPLVKGPQYGGLWKCREYIYSINIVSYLPDLWIPGLSRVPHLFDCKCLKPQSGAVCSWFLIGCQVQFLYVVIFQVMNGDQ